VSARRQTTFAKFQRERAVKEKRELKQARRQARKEEKLRAAATSETPQARDTDDPDASAIPSGGAR
jgi:hypothetical protein